MTWATAVQRRHRSFECSCMTDGSSPSHGFSTSPLQIQADLVLLHFAVLCFTMVRLFLQIKVKSLHQQRVWLMFLQYSLYGGVWNRTCNISKLSAYLGGQLRIGIYWELITLVFLRDYQDKPYCILLLSYLGYLGSQRPPGHVSLFRFILPYGPVHPIIWSNCKANLSLIL